MATSIVTKDLQNTVKKNKHIKEVYFTVDNSHFFSAHKSENENDKSLYARTFEATVPNKDKSLLGKKMLIGIPEMEIVETLTRDQIIKGQTGEIVTEDEN